MDCDRSKALVAVYLDGELKEDLAGPLRRHFMECSACRAAVSEAKAMSSWFEPGPAVAVPAGFAARVARRAFAGDQGAAPVEAERDLLVPQPAPVGPRASVGPKASMLGQDDRVVRFAMSLAALAAVALLALTLLLARGEGQSVGDSGLSASQPIESALEQLDELNRREAALERSPEDTASKAVDLTPRSR